MLLNRNPLPYTATDAEFAVAKTDPNSIPTNDKELIVPCEPVACGLAGWLDGCTIFWLDGWLDGTQCCVHIENHNTKDELPSRLPRRFFK